MKKINLSEKLSLFSSRYQPKIVGELNGQHVKLVKILGEFVWHHHEAEDELFLVLKVRFRMDFEGGSEWLEEGELIIVPRGLEHRPVAEEECSILLFEPTGTLNTGNLKDDEKTVKVLETI